MNNDILFCGSNTHGKNINCPLCFGLLWINLTWPGLPVYFFDESDTIDRFFACAWCSSVLNINEGNTEIIDHRNILFRINSNDILIIKENELSNLLFKLLNNKAIIKDNKIYEIGGMFHSKESLLTWCSNTVNHISQSNKLVRIPVLNI